MEIVDSPELEQTYTWLKPKLYSCLLGSFKNEQNDSS